MDLTSDVFYGLVKLSSGEEIIAKVCSFIEDEEVLIILDNPIIVHMSMHPQKRIPLVKVQPWISLSTETIYIIKRKDVITMTEIKDETLVNIHKNYEDKLSTFDERDIKPDNILNVDKARKKFEEIYLLDSTTRKQD